MNGFMLSAQAEERTRSELTTNDVEYYFDLLVDEKINQDIACKAATYFNKESYYVQLDFDCEEKENNDVFYDIYGTLTEPEVCLE